jgi:AraC-like DNA-binding protein
VVVEAGDVRALVDTLDEEMAIPGPGRALAIEALAEALLVRLLRGSATCAKRGRPSDPRIRHAVDLIETQLAEAIDVNDLARAAGMSRFHFSRVFRDEIGASPYAYLVERRLERAAARLRSERVSVTTAALDAGFRDLGRFARAFKQRFGMTAREYAAASASVTASRHPSSRRMPASS